MSRQMQAFLDKYLKGYFVGHLLPGVLFVLWAHAWLLAYLTHIVRRPEGLPAESGRSASGRGGRSPRGGPVFQTKAHYFSAELFVRLLATVVGMWAEGRSTGFGGMYYHDPVEERLQKMAAQQGVDETEMAMPSMNHANVATNMDNYFHGTMHAGFLLGAVIDLLASCGLLPPDAAMGGLVVSFSIEGFLFYSHASMQSSPKEGVEHMYLFFCIAGTAFICLLEIFYVGRDYLLLLRSATLAAQGGWLIYMAFTLDVDFPTPMSAPMAGSMYFVWVVGLVIIWYTVLYLAAVGVRCLLLRQGGLSVLATKYGGYATLAAGHRKADGDGEDARTGGSSSSSEFFAGDLTSLRPASRTLFGPGENGYGPGNAPGGAPSGMLAWRKAVHRWRLGKTRGGKYERSGGGKNA